MSTRDELEATAARAAADWRKAYDVLAEAEAVRAKANDAWDQVLVDRRKASTDRRKAGIAWDQTVPDRRKADSDRRTAEADIAAFSKVVNEQHEAYLAMTKADAAFLVAEMGLNAAAAARDRAVAVVTPPVNANDKGASWVARPIGRAIVTSLRKSLLG